MTRILQLGAILCLAAPLIAAGPASAHHRGVHAKPAPMSYYRAVKPQVRGYVARPGGGYSYTVEDVINTYSDTRARWGSTNFFRNWSVDRQTEFGPFDHGFFFDSGIAPRGGYAPYQN